MCGFSGISFTSAIVKDRFPYSLERFRAAAARIAYRGNSDHREHISDNMWLSHYRLAFQDVQAGIQPMLSHDGRHIIVFNGEVYNHLQLRKKIQSRAGIEFRTHSDTETILEGWKAFGETIFNEFDGEYAFVILDVKAGTLIAHRDRYGVKPLFVRLPNVNTRQFAVHRPVYQFSVDSIEFASEIKALCGTKQWQRDGLLRQFVGLYEPVCTPFEHIIHVPPGAVLRTQSGNNGFHCELHTNARPVRHLGNTQTATEDEFEQVFRNAITDRLLSDVELGVYLSGGVDSKSIAYELATARQAAGPTKSFTVGFTHEGYDETDEALRFADHIGMIPHVLRVDNDALNYAYPYAVESSELVQPFTNGAAKWWLSRFTRQYVQGVLTGDGADEVFCGYPSYRYCNWWKFIMRGRGNAKTITDVQHLLHNTPLGQSKRDNLYLGRFSAHRENPWLSGSSAEGDGTDFVNSLAMWGVPHPLFGQVQAITHALLGIEDGNRWLLEQRDSIRSIYSIGLNGIEDELAAPEHALLLWQNYFAQAHLPVLILNWVGDRMEMSNTLEGRTPFLSHWVYELMSQQRDTMLVHALRDKVLLRRTYARLFPARFAQTPKKQFNAPFLNAKKLVETFKSNSIFERVGLAGGAQSLENLSRKADQLQDQNPYLSTHLRTAYQTAIAMSIVDHTIVADQRLARDPAFEKTYLDRGGRVNPE